MTREQKLKMKEVYDLFILIFTSCNRREPKKCPFALGEENPCMEKERNKHTKEDNALLVLTEQVIWFSKRYIKRVHGFFLHGLQVLCNNTFQAHWPPLCLRKLIWRKSYGLVKKISQTELRVNNKNKHANPVLICVKIYQIQMSRYGNFSFGSYATGTDAA